MDIDAHGRPLLLEDRLAALGDVMSRTGLYHGRGSMQAMCWWEECISPFLGSEVAPHAWESVGEVPRSSLIDAVLDTWGGEGNWSKPDRESQLGGDMLLSSHVLRRGRLAACEGVEERNWLHLAPIDYRPWYQAITGLVEGILHVDNMVGVESRLNISTVRQERDILALLAADPDFLDGNWRQAGGPGRIRLGPPQEAASELEGFLGNNAGYVLSYCMKVPQDRFGLGYAVVADSPYQAAWMFGRLLLRRAAEHLPDLGDRVFMGHSRTLSCREEVDIHGLTVARFERDGVEVASARWLASEVEVDRSWTGSDGCKHPWIVQEQNGLLLDVDVEPEHRRQGIGTYVMRHAITRGCRRAACPFSEAEARLWGLHGQPGPLGRGDDWRLVAVQWPTCPTERAEIQAVPSP